MATSIRTETETVIKRVLPYLRRRGYQPETDIDFETAVKTTDRYGKGYVDLLVTAGRAKPQFLIEAKRSGKKLSAKDREQALSYGRALKFHCHLLDKGVGHRYIKPRTPRLNGKVERSHRIDAEEFYRLLDGAVIDDAKVFNDKLQEWEDYYNYHRPHGGLGGQTPYERLRQKTKARV